MGEEGPQTAVEALMALARVGPQRYQDGIIRALLRIDFLEQEEELQLPLLRAWQLAFTRMGRPDADTRARLAKRFEPLFPQKDAPLVNRELLA